jgi:hypothetical protein
MVVIILMISVIFPMNSQNCEFQENKKRKLGTRLSKQKKELLFKQSRYFMISDQKSFFKYMEANSNPYYEKAKEFLEREQGQSIKELRNKYDERHHIIPSNCGGPDEAWNLVYVTYDEHALLHQLRYQVYGEQADKIAALSRMSIPDNLKAFKSERALLGHQTMKLQNKGFYNSEIQRANGKKSGGKKTANREIGFLNQVKNSNKSLFEKNLLLIFRETAKKSSPEIVVVKLPGGSIQRPGQFREVLLEHTPKDHSLWEKICNDKYFTSNFTKVLNTFIPEYEGKNTRFQYNCWFVEPDGWNL